MHNLAQEFELMTGTFEKVSREFGPCSFPLAGSVGRVLRKPWLSSQYYVCVCVCGDNGQGFI